MTSHDGSSEGQKTTEGNQIMNSLNIDPKNSMDHLPALPAFVLIVVLLAYFAISPVARAVTPEPDGGYPDANTAEGTGALNSLNTNNGSGNTAVGYFALQSLTAGSNNTAVGLQTLFSNTGEFNTAIGASALQNNTSADFNTAVGDSALLSTTSGGGNTAVGASALQKNTTGCCNTATGVSALTQNTANSNTATGYQALTNNTSGGDNTANGTSALATNTTGLDNTATGTAALFSNTSGNNNTADGTDALFNNTIGAENTAVGVSALQSNTTGGDNTATGLDALLSNTTGGGNTANGVGALFSNINGSFNTANGENALRSNSGGTLNTAVGQQALNKNTAGSNNTALGALAGQNLTTGSNNIDIGANVLGNAGEANTLRIGKQGTQKSTFVAGIFGTAVSGSTVVVNSSGKLGVASSSARFKKAIKPMEAASEAILGLKPVSFRYKDDIDPEGTPQFGLIAEEVEKVNPDLVGRDENGTVSTVRYEAVNAMLLNEFLKAHRKLEEQQKQIRDLTNKLQTISDRIGLNKEGCE
jgi:trimeric autotransporter adhesin